MEIFDAAFEPRTGVQLLRTLRIACILNKILALQQPYPSLQVLRHSLGLLSSAVRFCIGTTVCRQFALCSTAQSGASRLMRAAVPGSSLYSRASHVRIERRPRLFKASARPAPALGEPKIVNLKRR